jgi:predicted Zn-dependent protease with MMP-like domain/Flp pilus assembly protein TadD
MLDRNEYWDCVEQAQQASLGGRGEEALEWLNEALRLNPLGAEAYNGKGEILWDRGLVDESLHEFGRALEVAPDYHPARLNRIEILIEEFQEHEEALQEGDQMLADRLEGPFEAEVYYLKAKALFYLDELDGALFLLRRAIQTHREVGVYRGFEGQILFELGRFPEAMRSLRQSQGLEPEVAHTLYHAALCIEHRGDYAEAERYFERASALDPDLYPQPVRISLDDFEAAANEALESLPRSIRRYLRNCPILIQDLPDAELIREASLSPQTLGLFQGTPVTDAGAASAVRLDVDQILLFKRNLEKVATSREQLIEEIQITAKHEIGHYLGLDEEEVERLGLG